MDERMQLRRTCFKAGLTTNETAQEKRRREALAVQRARRSNALDSIRGIEDLVGLFLTGDGSDCESEGKYDDAEENQEGSYNQTPASPRKTDQVSSGSSLSRPNKYRRFRDRCMRAEFLDLSEGLPADFENDWIMVGPIPKGKRCLALTFNEQKRATFGGSISTLLLSRKHADQIGEFRTNLPPNCIVDCIYDRANHTLWILDILKWKDQAMVDCEASFRFWWRDAKMSELTPQPLPSSTTLLCSSIGAWNTFSKAQVCEIADKMCTSYSATTQVITRSENNTSSQARLSISYECDGLLFYLKSATYESGESVLAGWVPLQAPQENCNQHGIAKLKWLCESGQDKNDDQMQC